MLGQLLEGSVARETSMTSDPSTASKSQRWGDMKGPIMHTKSLFEEQVIRGTACRGIRDLSRGPLRGRVDELGKGAGKG